MVLSKNFLYRLLYASTNEQKQRHENKNKANFRVDKEIPQTVQIVYFTLFRKAEWYEREIHQIASYENYFASK